MLRSQSNERIYCRNRERDTTLRDVCEKSRAISFGEVKKADETRDAKEARRGHGGGKTETTQRISQLQKERVKKKPGTNAPPVPRKAQSGFVRHTYA